MCVRISSEKMQVRDMYNMKAKVMHSQRTREMSLEPWIIAKGDGNVSYHCNCMVAGPWSILYTHQVYNGQCTLKSVTQGKIYWIVPPTKQYPIHQSVTMTFH
jgi:hypothetical protein